MNIAPQQNRSNILCCCLMFISALCTLHPKNKTARKTKQNNENSRTECLCIFHLSEIQNEDKLYANKYQTLSNLVYLRRNCLSECRRKRLIELCKCSLEFMYPTDNSTKCTISDFACLLKVGRKFNYEKPTNSRYFSDKPDPIDCQCLPECERIDYDVEISPLRMV